MKFVDIKNDIAFRKIFGNENKKEILISFLNAALELPKGKKIKKVEIRNPYQLPEIKGLKSSIFTKKLKDCKTLVDKWIYFIKNAENLDVIPENVKDKRLKHAYEDADRHNWTKEELESYDYADMRRQDEKGKTTVAVRKAVDNEKIEIAKEMISENESIEKIVKYTKLSIEIIEKLINELQNK